MVYVAYRIYWELISDQWSVTILSAMHGSFDLLNVDLMSDDTVDWTSCKSRTQSALALPLTSTDCYSVSVSCLI